MKVNYPLLLRTLLADLKALTRLAFKVFLIISVLNLFGDSIFTTGPLSQDHAWRWTVGTLAFYIVLLLLPARFTEYVSSQAHKHSDET
jgi:hypothetical protein